MESGAVAAGSRWRGLGWAAGMVLMFGLYMPVAKYWLHGVAPLLSTGLLYLSSGTTLFAVRWVRWLSGHRIEPARRLVRSDMRALSLGVMCGSTASPLLLIGLEHSSGTVASLLGNLEGVFTVGIALLFGDRLGKLEAAGAAAILAGGIVLSFNTQGSAAAEWIGMAAIAASCLAWAIDNMTTLRLADRDPIALMSTKCFLAGLLSLGLAFAFGNPWPGRGGLIAGVAIGACMWAVSTICFALAMRHLGGARVGSVLSLAPFVGAVGSILGLGEGVTVAVIASGALMAIGAYLMAHGHLGGGEWRRQVPQATLHESKIPSVTHNGPFTKVG